MNAAIRAAFASDTARWFDGPAAQDMITGTEGVDTLTGTSGDDSIEGLGGDDTLDGGGGADHLNGGNGNDVLLGGDGNDVLKGGRGDDTLDGGTGANFADFTNSTGVTINLTGKDAVAETSSGNDVCHRVTGFFIGEGDDHVTVSGTTAVVYDSGGNNVIDAHLGGVQAFLTGDGANTVTGGDGADVIKTGAAADTIDGGLGHNTIIAGGGDDVIRGGLDQATIDGGLGFDTLYVSGIANMTGGTISGIEALIGSADRDAVKLSGAGFAVYGMGGDDKLSSGAGLDTFSGGAGNDTFLFKTVTGSPTGQPDVILDLESGDQIDLHKIDADITVAHNQAFTLAAAFTHHAGELVLTYDSGTDRTLIQGDVDGDGTAEFTIAVAGDHHDFTNFVL